MQRVDANTIHLSSVTSKISLAIGTGMMNIHTFVNATWNQAATKPTSNRRKLCICTIYIYINVT